MAGLPQDARERRLTDFERLPPEVRAVQLQEVEGVEERLRLAPSPSNTEPYANCEVGGKAPGTTQTGASRVLGAKGSYP